MCLGKCAILIKNEPQFQSRMPIALFISSLLYKPVYELYVQYIFLSIRLTNTKHS